uniref:guanylate cyclase n=1 Tax=Mucochytrium quahogii TaxID=96639 RepID=A0A7S2S7C0_9STRA|mmetsp:Transcript_13263/g.21614  ORF Transcript_13263/g.21614 Transcript_13263/m.21614 type:complete len:724 (+) Transcript_13263:235-2406(+)
MYEVFNKSVYYVLCDLYDKEKLAKLFVELGIDFCIDEELEKDWVKEMNPCTLALGVYLDDSVLERLIAIVGKEINKSREEILELAGKQFFLHMMRTRAGMLHSMGSNLRDFILNLNQMHLNLRTVFKKARFPSFVVLSSPDEDAHSGKMRIKYCSPRTGFTAFAKGMLEQISETLYDLPIALEIESTRNDTCCKPPAPQPMRVMECSVFIVKLKNETGCHSLCRKNSNLLQARSASKVSVESLERYGLNNEFLLKPWPWHILVSRDLKILHLGPSLRSRVRDGADTGHVKLCEIFTLVSPPGVVTYEQFLLRQQVLFVVQLNEQPGIKLAGHFSPVPASDKQDGGLMFFGSPRFPSPDGMYKARVYLSDYGLHDANRDLLFKHSSESIYHTVSMALRAKSVELAKVTKELAFQKGLADSLLGQMLPKDIARQLMHKTAVLPEAYNDVTIFFSDIKGFTDISSQLEPVEVVVMLNKMYLVMDFCSDLFDVYKVETIGDAYMVVGGLPTRSPHHAERVAHFALAVSQAVPLLTVPRTNQRIQIRIGVHSGPVVAGVVGNKMPRYCLFGDTVNTASRMESNGIPGKIQCSRETYKKLLSQNFELERRGLIPMKGKGDVETFLLHGVPPQCEDVEEKISKCIEFAKSIADRPNECTLRECSIIDDILEKNCPDSCCKDGSYGCNNSVTSGRTDSTDASITCDEVFDQSLSTISTYDSGADLAFDESN